MAEHTSCSNTDTSYLISTQIEIVRVKTYTLKTQKMGVQNSLKPKK